MKKPPSKTLIVGMGQTGQSIARFYLKTGQDFDIFDTRATPPACEAPIPKDRIFTETYPESRWDDITQVIASPGIPLDTPIFQEARKRNLSIDSDIGLFIQNAKAPIIGITGTNGKSTVCTLVSQFIQASGHTCLLGGNIGTPALDLLNSDTPPDFYVLELSSFQLELTPHLKTHISVLLNISPNHLDRHGHFEVYLQSKLSIFKACDIAIMPQAYSHQVGHSHKIELTPLLISPTDIHYQGQVLLPVNQLSQDLYGRHNIENIQAALAVASELNLKPSGLAATLRSFKGLPYRCRLSLEKDGVKWFNDSKGTTIGATVAAILGLSEAPKSQENHLKTLLIAGGVGKHQDFKDLSNTVTDYVDEVILFGQDRELIAAALSGQVHRVETLAEAVLLAQQLMPTPGIILFSPACASFDQFRNYEHRGATFDELVLSVPGLN